MFEAKTMLYVYVETPLHAGSGRALGNVDLPIQRERVTGYPVVQASSLKGCLRAAGDEMPHFEAVFGPDTENADKHAGALSPGDAKILLFPVRSLAGVFAWTTSVEVLNRFRRGAAMVAIELGWATPEPPEEEDALIGSSALQAGGKVVLEEFTFTPKIDQAVSQIGQWLAENALPQTDEYDYWRKELPERLVILPNDDFRDFVTFSTEVSTRIKLDPDTKTVQHGALWTEEYLPTDALLYAP
ncbi:MAG: type III-B CRISPR module RAMP protein Cmr4, partial [Chloroflexota bacterium]|nr:type III-B CRISPR module RAMP protein Cmr4 [Chloroflexota bacterium]